MEPYLTRTEKQVARLLDEGLTSKEIAVRMNIVQRTVETHRYHISKKMEVHSSDHAVSICKRKKMF